MSGMMTIEIENLEASPTNYRLVSFPKRVKIDGISFSVNFEAAGSVEAGRVWRLYSVVGTPTPTPENPLSEYARPLLDAFGNSEKPVVTIAQTGVISTLGIPSSISVQSGDKTQTRTNVMLQEGVLAPGDYLALWIQLESGDVEGINYDLTTAVVTISYTETTDDSFHELLTKYPNLD
jgi:hypothetical protein